MKEKIPVTLKVEEVRKHQSDFSDLICVDNGTSIIDEDAPVPYEVMYKLIDNYIRKNSVKDFVEVLYNVLKDQNEEKKEDKK